MIWLEAEIVSKRIDAYDANRAALMQMAIASILSQDARKAFTKKIKEMTSSV